MNEQDLSEVIFEKITLNNKEYEEFLHNFLIICEIPGLVLYTHEFTNNDEVNNREYIFSSISYNHGNTRLELKLAANSKLNIRHVFKK